MDPQVGCAVARCCTRGARLRGLSVTLPLFSASHKAVQRQRSGAHLRRRSLSPPRRARFAKAASTVSPRRRGPVPCNDGRLCDKACACFPSFDVPVSVRRVDAVVPGVARLGAREARPDLDVVGPLRERVGRRAVELGPEDAILAPGAGSSLAASQLDKPRAVCAPLRLPALR